jgi:excisionase family DNA binding protein
MTLDISAILEKPTCTVEEFSRIFGLSKNPAYEAIRRGDVPSIRLGGSIRIPTAHIRAKLGLEPLRGAKAA